METPPSFVAAFVATVTPAVIAQVFLSTPYQYIVQPSCAEFHCSGYGGGGKRPGRYAVRDLESLAGGRGVQRIGQELHNDNLDNDWAPWPTAEVDYYQLRVEQYCGSINVLYQDVCICFRVGDNNSLALDTPLKMFGWDTPNSSVSFCMALKPER